MLALCRSSRQIVVADAELDDTDMVGELLENDNASRTKRDTHWRSVLLKRSM
jgi:hypothetical protein